MPSTPINIFTPEGGLNANLAKSRLPEQDASETSNILYERGVMKTAFGFSATTENGLPLGEPVHGMHMYRELSGQETLIAVTRTKIFRRDLDSDNWVDISNASSPLSCDFTFPPSFVEVAHDDLSPNFYHLLICDSGASPIQRWTGESEATTPHLLGGANYHTGSIHTGHYARQGGLFKNHTMLMSPSIDGSGTGVLVEQPQQIRWSDTGNFDTGKWNAAGTAGAGFVLLLDTSDVNVRMLQLGDVMIVYQQNSIWGLVFVGGNKVFDPRVMVQSIGLLSPGLIYSYRNAHYFIGSDFNVYEYFGGSVIRDISAVKSIDDRLKDDLDATVLGHARIGMEAKGRRLMIGVVMEGDNHVRRVYTRNMNTSAWGIHDYDNYTTSAQGVTAMVLVPSERTVIGETYEDLEVRGTKYVESFGLVPSSGTNPNWAEAASEHVGATSLKPTSGTAYGTYWTEVTQAANDWATSTAYTLGNVVLDDRGAGDGLAWVCVKAHDSAAGNKPGLKDPGPSAGEAAHWVRLDLPLITNIARNSATLFTVTFEYDHGLDAVTDVREGDTLTFRDCAGTGLTAPNGERTIVDIPSTTTVQCSSFDVVATATDATGSATLCKFRNGHTYFPSDKVAATDYVKYSDWMGERFGEEALVLGDQAGNIYSFAEDKTTWAGTAISASHETKEHDFGLPSRQKRFQQITIEAKGASVIVGYSVDRSAFTDFAARSLTSEFQIYRFFVNETGNNMRLRFKNSGGSDFQIRSYGFPNVQAQDFV